MVTFLFYSFRLRLERGRIGEEIGALEKLQNLHNLELIDFELKVGFGKGFLKLKSLKKILLIPTYKEEVSDNYYVLPKPVNQKQTCK
jgi:hypothetical protein